MRKGATTCIPDHRQEKDTQKIQVKVVLGVETLLAEEKT
jgi:hypothetical protein